MFAMHDQVHSVMKMLLDKKLEMMLRTLHFEMTHEECLHLVAPSKHHEMLTLAATIANVNHGHHWMTLSVPAFVDGCNTERVKLLMRTHAEKTPPLTPRDPFWQLPTEQAPFIAGEKVIAWLGQRYVLGRKFAVVREVLNWLNRNCENSTQVRYMFPAVMHLTKPGLDAKMDRWLAKYSDYKAVKSTPSVSPELKKAIQDASALLTQCALIGDELPEATRTEVLIEPMTWYEMSKFPFNGHYITRM